MIINFLQGRCNIANLAESMDFMMVVSFDEMIGLAGNV